MLYYSGNPVEENGTVRADKQVLIAVPETTSTILKENVKMASSDWLSSVVCAMLFYMMMLIRQTITTEQSEAAFESVVLLFMMFILIIRIGHIFVRRNTDREVMHAVCYTVGVVIGYLFFRFRINALLQFTPESFLHYAVPIVTMNATLEAALWLERKMERVRQKKKNTSAGVSGGDL